MITKTIITQPEVSEVLKVYNTVKSVAKEQKKSVDEILKSLTSKKEQPKEEVKEKKAKSKS